MAVAKNDKVDGKFTLRNEREHEPTKGAAPTTYFGDEMLADSDMR